MGIMVKTTNIDKYGKKRRGKSLVTGDCNFPFRYKGEIHKVCVDGSTGKWCATSTKPNLNTLTWAYCIDEKYNADGVGNVQKKPEKKKSSKKINFDNIQILDEVEALEKESG